MATYLRYVALMGRHRFTSDEARAAGRLGGTLPTDPRVLFAGHIAAREGGCVEWVGASRGDGYGVFRIAGRKTAAHRAAWELFVGPIPEGMLVLHRCDNRRCVRTEHLFLGTHRDNSADMVLKGRSHAGTGERAPRPKLTRAQVDEMRVRRAREGASYCSMAKDYGVTRETVRLACLGITWPT